MSASRANRIGLLAVMQFVVGVACSGPLCAAVSAEPPETPQSSGAAAATGDAAAAATDSPNDLLDRAIAERPASSRGNGEAAALRAQADRLLDDRRYDEAIAAYEQAYRLDPSDRDGYLQLLLARQAAGRLSDADREALALLDKSRSLRIDEVIRGVQLNIVQAREALRAGQGGLVHAKVAEARAALGRLPRDVDVAIYDRELNRLSLSARRKAARDRQPLRAQAQGRARQSEPIRAGDIVPPAAMEPTDDATAARRADDQSTAARQARQRGNRSEPDRRGEPAPDRADRGGNAARDFDRDADIADRALASGRYEPDGRLVVPDRWSEHPESDDFNRYQSDLDFSIRTSRANWYFGGREGLAAPRDEGLVYPADWSERTARRAERADGEIYRGPTQQTEDGQDYYTAIYDLAELLHPVPNFYGTEPSNALRLQSALDREWLRRRSMIFGGWAPDLAAGTPLLQFYGGIDNWAVSPRYDADELERILRVIDGTIGK